MLNATDLHKIHLKTLNDTAPIQESIIEMMIMREVLSIIIHLTIDVKNGMEKPETFLHESCGNIRAKVEEQLIKLGYKIVRDKVFIE